MQSPRCCFTFYKKSPQLKLHTFQSCINTQFQYPKPNGASVVSTSKIPTSATLLLLIVVDLKIRGWHVLQWHNIYAKFRENRYWFKS